MKLEASILSKLENSFATQKDFDVIGTEVLNVLNNASLFKALMPVSLGGKESCLADFSKIIENVVKVDGSTGWCLMIGATLNGAVCAYASDEAVDTIFGQVSKEAFSSIIAGQSSPRAQVKKVKSGLIISGNFKCGSGINHANWIICGFIHPSHGQHCLGIIPKNNIRLKGGWNTIGLTGSGSLDYEIDECLITDDFIFLHDCRTPIRGGNTFFCGLVTVMLSGHIGIALGLADQALTELERLTKIERVSGRLIDRDDFLIGLGRNKTSLYGAKAYAAKSLTSLDKVIDHQGTENQHIDSIRLAAIHATETARSVIRFSYDYAGMSPIQNDHKLNVIFRDFHVANQHLLVNSFQYKSIIKKMIEENYDI